MNLGPLNIMLDLETLGKTPGSVITSIGAVAFGGGLIHSEFYRRVGIQSCLDAGLKVDGSTIEWWLTQSDAARLELTLPGNSLAETLQAFSHWVTTLQVTSSGPEVWGNGPSFDCSMMKAAYNALRLHLPWSHKQERCYRTARALLCESDATRAVVRTGVKHHALDDARHQARYLMALLGETGQMQLNLSHHVPPQGISPAE